mgnify:FL=1|jgi:hypothetical protein
MRKETITYTDYNNVTRTEDFFFNLNEAELTALQYGVDGGLKEMLERIVKSNDNKQIMVCFHELIAKSYGEKSPDGRRFIKSKELSEAFMQTEAYNELMLRFMTDANYSAGFINDVLADVTKRTEERNAKKGENNTIVLPAQS